MKTWWWLCLAILTCMVGCAQGYSERQPVYPGEESVQLNRNPETQEQYEMRIWQEESHH